MSTHMQLRVWRWIAISAGGAAIAALVRVVGRRGPMRRRSSRSRDESAADTALEMAGGAMSNEGGPARNV